MSKKKVSLFDTLTESQQKKLTERTQDFSLTF